MQQRLILSPSFTNFSGEYNADLGEKYSKLEVKYVMFFIVFYCRFNVYFI